MSKFKIKFILIIVIIIVIFVCVSIFVVYKHFVSEKNEFIRNAIEEINNM